MKAAEWRKRIYAVYSDQDDLSFLDALLRDFEAAEQICVIQEDTIRTLQRAVRDAEARAAQLLDAAHRLEDRCVAAEEERNAYERQLLAAVKACDGETAKAVAAEARAQAAEAADMDHQAWWLEEKATRELAEARANTLEARLLDLESQIGNTVAPQERGGEEEGDTDGK
jgi:hypothetical protein